jgi:membrane protein YdbS with pleckstrin-like domain
MTIFDTDSRQAFIAGVSALALTIAMTVLMFISAGILPKNGLTFALIIAGILFLVSSVWLGYHLYNVLNSSYAIDRNSLVIRWGAIREVVPMADVQKIVSANELTPPLKLRRLPLSGWWFGTSAHPDLGKVSFFSTAPAEDQLVVVLPNRAFVLSPYDAEAFVEAFQQRFYMGPTQLLEPATLTPAWMDSDFWLNRSIQSILILPFIICLALLGMCLIRYPNLPGQVAFHYDSNGMVDRYGSPDQIFILFYVAVGLLIANIVMGWLLYRNGERQAAYITWGGNVVIQLVFFVAGLFVTGAT